MKAYSMDLRKRVLAMCDAGHGATEVARVFDVSESWVRRLKQRRREDGTIAPRPRGGDRNSKFKGVTLAQLQAFVEEQPDATLEQLRERCRRELGIECSVPAIWRATQKLGLSFKKKRSGRRSRTVPTSPANDGTSESPHASSTPASSSSSTNPGPKRT